MKLDFEAPARKGICRFLRLVDGFSCKLIGAFCRDSLRLAMRRIAMRLRERRDSGQNDLFKARLAQTVDMNHALAKLARAIDWGFLEKSFGAVYSDGPGQPPLPAKQMAGLSILKHMHDPSDEVLCERWVESPYYQLFCGEEFFIRAYPREAQEMVFDAHDWAFAFFKRACQRRIYDNMKTAIETVFAGKNRLFNRRFAQMCSRNGRNSFLCRSVRRIPRRAGIRLEDLPGAFR
jgi:hypothetical protein